MAAFSACAFLVGFVPPAGAASGGNADRAVASYVAMERYLFDPVTKSYRDAPTADPSAAAWPVSQAVAATIAVARIPGAATDAGSAAIRGFGELTKLRTGAVYHSDPGGAVYFDDNEWIAQDLLDWNEAHPSAAAVKAASAIFSAVVRAWDGDAATPCAGGVYWTTDADVRDRNTVSTANGAVVGLRLYALTKKPVFLYWSRRMLDWMNACMLGPDGLYWDHVTAGGVVDRREWSYNQGSPIAAYLLLYETTGDTTALARAEHLADCTLRAFSGRWLSEPPEFAAIFFRHLLELAAVDGRPDYVAAAQAYAEDAWNVLRDPQTGLFGSTETATLLGQAAFVQLYAHLAITDSGAAASGSPPPAAGPTGRGSDGAHADPGRGSQAPRTQPGRADRSGRPSRTSR